MFQACLRASRVASGRSAGPVTPKTLALAGAC